jgi:hypothetical protein
MLSVRLGNNSQAVDEWLGDLSLTEVMLEFVGLVLRARSGLGHRTSTSKVAAWR